MFRKSRSLAIVMVAAGAAVTVAVAQLPASSAQIRAPRMTASELAGGLLFNQGRAAPYLTALDRPSVKMTGAVRILLRSVDRKLEQHPELAGTFARDVQSGNRIKVAAGLAILGRFAHQSLIGEFGQATTRRMEAQAAALLSSPAAMTPDGSGGSNFFLGFLVGFYAAAAIFAIAVVLAVGALAAGAKRGPDALAAERVVNLVAIGLQAAR